MMMIKTGLPQEGRSLLAHHLDAIEKAMEKKEARLLCSLPLYVYFVHRLLNCLSLMVILVLWENLKDLYLN